MKVVDVDLPLLQTMPIPRPGAATDKDARGRVFVVGGSSLSPGAVVLAAEAALRSGAGKVMVGVARTRADILGVIAPEFGIVGLSQTRHGEPRDTAFGDMRRGLKHCDVLLLGPGMTDSRNAHALARKALRATDSFVVLDAAAIPGFRRNAASLRDSKQLPILTPHLGEMSSLTGIAVEEIRRDPVGLASTTAKRLNCIVVLKSATTFVAHPRGAVWRHCGGSVGLGTAGSGDVLAGLVAGILARGAAATAACLWGVYLHGKAGAHLARSVGSLGFLARELPGLFPRLLDESAIPLT